jgi:hypothetical protein
MTDLLSYLERFNRKERFLLVGWALGNESFALGEQFRQTLGDELGLSIPQGAFVAMDYHLDWLWASLVLGTEGGEDRSHANPSIVRRIGERLGPVVAATQEDIDLIIAYKERDQYQIVIAEAKGVTGWTNRQMESKAARLEAYFGSDGDKWPNVTPHFVIVSPRDHPKGLHLRSWPDWMTKDGRVPFVKMPPLADRLLRVTRWDDGQNKSTRDGDRWKAVDA